MKVRVRTGKNPGGTVVQSAPVDTGLAARVRQSVDGDVQNLLTEARRLRDERQTSLEQIVDSALRESAKKR